MNSEEYINFRSDLKIITTKAMVEGADYLIREINNKLIMFYDHRTRPNS